MFYCCTVFNHVCIYMKNCMYLLWSMVFPLPHVSQKYCNLPWHALRYLTRAQSISAFLTLAGFTKVTFQDLQCESFRAQGLSLVTWRNHPSSASCTWTREKDALSCQKTLVPIRDCTGEGLPAHLWHLGVWNRFLLAVKVWWKLWCWR